jgi:putative hydrolase of the HAD superfamily
MPIRCITFDLDDTLWDGGPVLGAAERKFYDWLARRCPDIAETYGEEELRAHRHEFYERLPEMRHDFTYLRKQWLAHLGRAWGYGVSLVEPGFDVFWEARNAVALFEGVSATLEQLKSTYKVGAITNGNADVRHIGIGHLFDFVVTAAHAGALKPAPDIFHAALERAGAVAAETVHVGDDPVNDMRGAAAVGMRTVWVNPGRVPWPGGVRPDVEVCSVNELIGLLESRPPFDRAGS